MKQIAKTSGKTKVSVIKKHLTDFAWIKTVYNIVDPYTKSDLSEVLKSSQVESARKFLPTNCHPVLVGLQCGIFMRNRMKELCQKLWYAFDPIAIYLANQLSLSHEEFLMLTPEEVLKSISAGEIHGGQIKERQKNFVVGFINDNFILLAGDSVGDLPHFFNPNISKNITEFKGNIACKGNAKGIVRIIKSKNEFNKFNKGEILVTSMTTPDFILIMKKSSAIVTDEGGLSSHAAIVSRELNIPCIIGTKIATKVLHDGDLVEVNADKGIVKILKSSEKQTH